MKTSPEQAPQPMKYDPRAEGDSYTDMETLITDGGHRVEWSSDWNDLKSALQSISATNNDDFFNIFGKGCTGIQLRSKKLICSGHYDIAKAQVAKVAIKANNHPAVAIRVQSVPSMKREPYWVMTVFDLQSKKFVGPPSSRCNCPAGLGGCSHLRGLYAILGFIGISFLSTS